MQSLKYFLGVLRVRWHEQYLHMAHGRVLKRFEIKLFVLLKAFRFCDHRGHVGERPNPFQNPPFQNPPITFFPDDEEHTSADLESLKTIMLRMMNETGESLDSSEVP